MVLIPVYGMGGNCTNCDKPPTEHALDGRCFLLGDAQYFKGERTPVFVDSDNRHDVLGGRIVVDG